MKQPCRLRLGSWPGNSRNCPKKDGSPWGAHQGPHPARAASTSPRRDGRHVVWKALARLLSHTRALKLLREHFWECGLPWLPASPRGKWGGVEHYLGSSGDHPVPFLCLALLLSAGAVFGSSGINITQTSGARSCTSCSLCLCLRNPTGFPSSQGSEPRFVW